MPQALTYLVQVLARFRSHDHRIKKADNLWRLDKWTLGISGVSVNVCKPAVAFVSKPVTLVAAHLTIRVQFCRFRLWQFRGENRNDVSISGIRRGVTW